MNGQAKKRRHEPHTLPFRQRAIPDRFQRPGVKARLSRLAEFIAACALIAFTLPLMAIVAIVIKCDSPGPLFERRWRIGSSGRRFQALMFRTTLELGGAADAWRRPSQMTRLGPYLRYTGIDALPQLFNVLRGETSITDSVAYLPSSLD